MAADDGLPPPPHLPTERTLLTRTDGWEVRVFGEQDFRHAYFARALGWARLRSVPTMDETEHRVHEERALALWEAGELEAAATAYEAALTRCPPTHWARGQYHTGRASVLAALGRNDEAREQLELALAHAIETHGEGEPPVGVARFFLGNHCVEQRAFAAALMTVMPAIAGEVGPLSLLRTVQARALAGMGRQAEARKAARAAVDAAEPARRERIEAQLAALLDAPE